MRSTCSPFLLIHGSAGSTRDWDPVIAELAGAVTITPDLVGYGATEMPRRGGDFTINEELRNINEQIKSLDRKAHVVGYSYGGVVALALASSHPQVVESLTLIEPVIFPVLFHARNEIAFSEFAAARSDFDCLLGADRRRLAIRQFLAFWNQRDVWRELSIGRRAKLMRMADKMSLDWQIAFETDFDWRTFDMPTRLIVGDRTLASMRALVAALHSALSHSSVALVSGADHLMIYSQPKQVARLLLNAGAPVSPMTAG